MTNTPDEQINFTPLSDIDTKINRVFEGLVVRKDLGKYIKLASVLPSYVIEYLLGNNANGNDKDTILTGIQTVRDLLASQFVDRNKSELFKSKIREKGQLRIIDKIDVTLDERKDVYLATFANLGVSKIIVNDDTANKYPKLFTGGLWCEITIRYEYISEKINPFILIKLRPIQFPGCDLQEYFEKRREFTTAEWIVLMMQTIGWNAHHFTRRQHLMYLLRLVPFIERNYNLIELGPKGTGKTHVNSELSPHGSLVSGSTVTKAKLFGEARAKAALGLIGSWDNVTFDEFASKTTPVTPEIVNIMKNYMANGSFNRGPGVITAQSSMSFAGNTTSTVETMLQYSHLFEALPPLYIDSAFLDRMHAYLPGWEVPRIRTEAFTSGYGLIVDYLSEIMHELRSIDYSTLFEQYFELHNSLSVRDTLAIRHTFSGMVKLLYPHGDLQEHEVRELLTFAMECRKRVADQLPRIDPTMGYVKFCYRKIGDQNWEVVETPEEVEFSHTYYKLAPNKHDKGVSDLEAMR
jgi:ATP-dependent Lon protease